MSTFTPMEKLGTFVRADKSQAKGTKFLFVYNKIEPTESLRSEWWFGGYPGSDSQRVRTNLAQNGPLHKRLL